MRTLGMTSACRGEGVSTLAAHLAITAAADGPVRVLLVDADLEQPTLHRLLGTQLDPGLAECLRAERGPAEAAGESGFPGVSMLGAGRLRDSPARLWDLPTLPGLVEDLSHEFELVVFDLPPVAQQSWMRRLAGLLDGVLLVVEAERVSGQAARRAKELLRGTEAHLLGAVLNKQREGLPHWLRTDSSG